MFLGLVVYDYPLNMYNVNLRILRTTSLLFFFFFAKDIAIRGRLIGLITCVLFQVISVYSSKMQIFSPHFVCHNFIVFCLSIFVISMGVVVVVVIRENNEMFLLSVAVK